MTAQAAIEGRFLGGRPPYGYRLADAGPHPNPAKAADGKRLHALEPDPQTAPIVKRIFEEYAAGRGCFAIAERLTRECIPSPSGYDRDRNPHRHGLAWGKSALRAILRNPRYTGFEVWARQRRDEVLVDVEDVSAGHDTVMRWNSEDHWVWSAQPAHEALVTRDTFNVVQARLAGRTGGKGPREAPRKNRSYALRHHLRCGICGRYMQGAVSGGRTYYRCKFPSEYAIAAELGHARSVNLREDDSSSWTLGWPTRSARTILPTRAPSWPASEEATRQPTRRPSEQPYACATGSWTATVKRSRPEQTLRSSQPGSVRSRKSELAHRLA